MPATSASRDCWGCSRGVANPAQGVDACDRSASGGVVVGRPVANPAQGVDACDGQLGTQRRNRLLVANPAQGVDACDTGQPLGRVLVDLE